MDKRARLPSDKWEKHKPTITRLYVEDGERLEDVMAFMEKELKFKATKAAYKNKLSRWGAQKRKRSPKEATRSYAIQYPPTPPYLDDGLGSPHDLDAQVKQLLEGGEDTSTFSGAASLILSSFLEQSFEHQ